MLFPVFRKGSDMLVFDVIRDNGCRPSAQPICRQSFCAIAIAAKVVALDPLSGNCPGHGEGATG